MKTSSFVLRYTKNNKFTQYLAGFNSRLSRRLASGLIVFAVVIAQLSGITAINLPAKASAETGITNIGRIGGYTSPPLDFPNSVAIDTQGNIFVVNRDNDEIIKYNSQYEYESRFGEDGNGDGQFGSVLNVAFDSNGSIYAVDNTNNRVQKFDSSGTYLSQFGTFGTGDGEFNSPDGIAIDSQDNVYIVDSQNHRVQKFDSSGTHLSQFGTFGTGDGEFRVPQNVTIDNDGNVYVTDGDNRRVQKFDSQGNYISQFGSQGTENGQFTEIYGIAIDDSDNIYVGDAGSNRVQIFNSAGEYQSQFGSNGEDDGQFEYLRGIRLAPNGDIVIADSNNDRVQKCTQEGVCESIISYSESNLLGAYSVGVGQNQVFAPSIENQSPGLGTFDLTGTNKETWPPIDSYDYVVATSPNYLYTISAFLDNSFKFKKMDYTGQTLATWDLPGLGYGIAADSQDNLYWANQVEDKIVKFSSNGTILAQFGSLGAGNGQFNLLDEGPSYITTDKQDNVYVVDNANYRIQKFDSNGNFLMKFGFEGNEPGEFNYAMGVAVDSLGNIYVSDVNDNGSRIQKFNSSGEYVTEYTQNQGEVFGDGGFEPYGLATGPNGRLFVALPASGSIDILCDHDVSTDGCQSLGSEGGSGSPLTDINGDGIVDSSQPHVQAFTAPGTDTPVGLVVSDDCTLADTSIATESSKSTQDPAYSYPNGLVSFTADCGTPGYTTMVNLYYYDTTPNDLTLRKYNPTTSAYFNLTGQYGATLEQTTLNNRTVTIASYQITDGQDLDIDSLANGSIQDPVGLAQQATSSPNTGLPTHWLLGVK